MMKSFAFRLKPHQDLKNEILNVAKKYRIDAGCIITCVGSLEQFNIRYANQKNGVIQKGFFEIVSLTGTFSQNAAHIHISVADGAGKTIGGHLLEDNLIYTTAEIVIGIMPGLQFVREKDSTYGYDELVVKSDGTVQEP